MIETVEAVTDSPVTGSVIKNRSIFNWYSPHAADELEELDDELLGAQKAAGHEYHEQPPPEKPELLELDELDE